MKLSREEIAAKVRERIARFRAEEREPECARGLSEAEITEACARQEEQEQTRRADARRRYDLLIAGIDRLGLLKRADRALQDARAHPDDQDALDRYTFLRRELDGFDRREKR